MGVEMAKAELEAAGFVVVKRKSQEALRRRAEKAEHRLQSSVREVENTTGWALDAFKEQRRLSDRLTFVYGEARAAGCSVEQLAGGA